MSGKSAHGRSGKVPYYEYARVSKHQAALNRKVIHQCDPYRIQAQKIEPEVWREVKNFLLDEDSTKEILEIAKASAPVDLAKLEKEKIQKKIGSMQNQMENLVDRISRLPKGIDESLFLKQIHKLQQDKDDLQGRLRALKAEGPSSDSVIPYDDFVKFTAYLRELLKSAGENPEVQSEITRILVHRIDVTSNGIEIRFNVSCPFLKRELGDKTPSSNSISSRSRPLAKFFKESGSSTLTNGGGGGN